MYMGVYKAPNTGVVHAAKRCRTQHKRVRRNRGLDRRGELRKHTAEAAARATEREPTAPKMKGRTPTPFNTATLVVPPT